MTGMEHAIEQAAWIIHGCTGDEDGAPVAARALAEAGLLAPAPLREVQAEAWEEGYRADAYYPKNAPWIDAKNPYREPVDRAEGDGRVDQ